MTLRPGYMYPGDQGMCICTHLSETPHVPELFLINNFINIISTHPGTRVPCTRERGMQAFAIPGYSIGDVGSVDGRIETMMSRFF